MPGYFSDFFSKIAKALKIFICVGLTEKFLIKNEIKFYNTAILIDDNGEIILKHRKINEIGEAKNFYETGCKTEVINTAIGCIGVNICSDNCNHL